MAMSDGLIWLLVGAIVPLVWYSVVPSVRKPNLLLLLVIGIAGAVVGGPLGEEMAMVQPELDLGTIAGGIGAGLGALVSTMAYRLVSDLLHAPVQQREFNPTELGTPARRSRSI
jgi:uncharacterized membrane protein YeaQ/YmgE (transglycosylase-associated protein family)